MNPQKLLEFFADRRDRRMPLVLVTVYATEGSTYSKAGAHMLIDENGIFQGMLSGGCLEGDLAIRAQAVLENAASTVVSYDLAADSDELWGLGVGCDGLIRVILQPLMAASDYEPFASIARQMSASDSGVLALVVESARADLPAGAAVVIAADGEHTGPLRPANAEPVLALARRVGAGEPAGLYRVATDGAELAVLCSVIRPVPRILILGAGLDAEPVLAMAAELGWRCRVADHRPGYLERGDFSRAEDVLCFPPQQLAERVNLDAIDAVVVMSHHLATDRRHLATLAGSPIGYIGLLGPVARRERLLAEIGPLAAQLDGRLDAPAGLDLGGRGPAAIALSIIAGLQQYLAARDAPAHVD